LYPRFDEDAPTLGNMIRRKIREGDLDPSNAGVAAVAAALATRLQNGK